MLCVLMTVAAVQAWAAPEDDALVPQRIFLGITADPAHSQTVTWRTAAPAAAPQAQLAPWTADPSPDKAANTIQATAAAVEIAPGVQVTHYEALFDALEPGKGYAYRVGDGNAWSEWNYFRTATTNPDPYKFIFLGDAQRGVKTVWSRAVREAVLRAPDARFILHAGDLVDEGYDDAQWAEWCYALGFLSARYPNITAVGNHDMNLPEGTPNYDKPAGVSPLWRAHFAYPKNGPADTPVLEEEAYFFDYQGVRFIVLETNAYALWELYDPETRKLVQDKQIPWLEALLKDNPNRWTVVLQHEPMYQSGKNPDNPLLRDTLLPLFDKYRVDLVLQGHDHTYARSKKLAAGQEVAPADPGTVYVVSVSGSRMYPANPIYANLMVKTQPNTQMYQIVDVNGDRLRYEAYTVTGMPVDSFELRKDANGVSTFVDETAPAQPQPAPAK
jgi:3',5'-cyclic AMP phosphodiesterase CpdA